MQYATASFSLNQDISLSRSTSFKCIQDTIFVRSTNFVFLDGILSDYTDHLFSHNIFILMHTPTNTHVHSAVVNSLGLDVSLLPYSVGNLLTVVVFFLGFCQLFYRLLQLCLNAAQLIYGLYREKGKNKASC